MTRGKILGDGGSSLAAGAGKQSGKSLKQLRGVRRFGGYEKETCRLGNNIAPLGFSVAAEDGKLFVRGWSPRRVLTGSDETLAAVDAYEGNASLMMGPTAEKAKRARAATKSVAGRHAWLSRLTPPSSATAEGRRDCCVAGSAGSSRHDGPEQFAAAPG